MSATTVKYMNSILISERATMSPVPPPSPDALSTSAATSPVKSAARVLDILDDLVAYGPGSLQQLAQRLSIPKSSLHALLKTMLGRGWIETEATGSIYSLGIRSVIVSSAYLDEDRVVARTSTLWCEVRVIGEFVLVIGPVPDAEPAVTPDRGGM